MGFINLLGQLLTPDYSTLFIVNNEVLDEMLIRSNVSSGFTDGIVGRLIPADEEYCVFDYQPRRLFHRRFTTVAEQGPATFNIEQTTDQPPLQPFNLVPIRIGRIPERPMVQIPACPRFKRKLKLYETRSLLNVIHKRVVHPLKLLRRAVPRGTFL
jgi:hypothetical protein